jgi:chaperonin GroES
MEIKMNFKPLYDRILVQRRELSEKTAGGIIIPDAAKEKPVEGEVIAVGSGARADDGSAISMTVKVGDRVLFAKWGGNEVTIDDKEYLIMKESDVLGILV